MGWVRGAERREGIDDEEVFCFASVTSEISG